MTTQVPSAGLRKVSVKSFEEPDGITKDKILPFSSSRKSDKDPEIVKKSPNLYSSSFKAVS
jgi:hypothetical protein